MSIRSRVILLLLVLSLLSFLAWLLAGAHGAGRAAQERDARLATQVLVGLFDDAWEASPTAGGGGASADAAPAGAAADAMAARSAAERALAVYTARYDEGWQGLLVDRQGGVVLKRPADLADSVPPGGLGRAASAGWLELGEKGGRRAYFGRTGPGWTWITPLPCPAGNLACAGRLTWAAGALMALLALTALSPWLPVRPGGVAALGRWAPAGEDAEAAARRERLELLSRLLGRCTHEFNNQWGIISNSAYLVERYALDERLAMPVRAMRRAVEGAGALTRRLQNFSRHPAPQPAPLELVSWLSDSEGPLKMVLSKQVALDLRVGPGPLWSCVDPGELDLALIDMLLFLCEEDGELRRIRLSTTSLGSRVEVRVEAMREGAGQEAGEPAAAPQRWKPAAASAQSALGTARRLARAAGGGVWVASVGDRPVAASLVLPGSEAGTPNAPGDGPPRQAATPSKEPTAWSTSNSSTP